MTLNPFLGMDREQLDQCRRALQLGAALGSFEAALDAVDRCTGDEVVETKLWELSREERDKLALAAEFVEILGGGDEAREALREHSERADPTPEASSPAEKLTGDAGRARN